MFIRKGIKVILSEIRDLIPVVALALLLLLNVMRIRSFLIGTVASIAYIAITGYYIGKVFLVEEGEKFVRWMFGIFLVLCLFIFVGTPVVVLYQLDVVGLAAVLFAAPVLLLAKTLLWPNLKDAEGKKQDVDNSRFSLIYVVFVSLIVYSIFLLLEARSGWVYGEVWSVVSPSFFVVYFFSAFVLIGIILYSNTWTSSKILVTILFSLVSSSVFAIVLYPGSFGDPLDHLGFARLIYTYGSLRQGISLTAFQYFFILKEKGLALLSGTLSKMFWVDVYWVHTFITPVIWSLFVPLAAFKIGKLLDWKDRVSILAAFLTSFYVGFVVWASRSTGNSLGFVPFFVSLCFSLWYSKTERRLLWFLAMFTALVSTLVHPLTGTMAFIFILFATGLRKYENMRFKHRHVARLLLLLVLASGCLVILALFGVNAFIYSVLAPQYAGEASTAFSFEILRNTDIWSLIFGEYVDASFRDLALSIFMPFFGIVGLAYALKKTERRETKILVWAMLITFVLCIVEYTILRYAMINVLFGPGRLWTFRDFVAVPFVGLVVISVVEYFEGATFGDTVRSIVVFKKWSVSIIWRYVLTWLLVGMALSALVTASIQKDYEWLRGLQPTELEVQAVKYIDENTNGRYVVFSMPATTQIGWGFVGTWNFRKYYVYNGELGKLPSVADMMDYMELYQAGVGYFIASARTPNLEKTVEEASRMYGLFKALSDENGKIYIFNYEIPPLPSDYPDPDADVMAFYWSTPPGLFVQNGLFRVILGNASLDVRDFWGDLYESIDFNETSLGEKPIGHLKSIDRYDSYLETWVEWNSNDRIAPASRFQFRLNFEGGSLMGAVVRGSPYVQLSWESDQESTFSLQTGDFKRLYVPGLVGGINSYNISSRHFGLLYTTSKMPNVAIRPIFKTGGTEGSYLIFNDVRNYCNLTITTGYLSYEFYVHNDDIIDHWVDIEVWVPDVIYAGSFPPFEYSVDDGTSWSGSVTYTNFPQGIPIRTYGGTEANWYFSRPADSKESPIVFRAFSHATGGPPMPSENFTESGGGQQRMLFGLYLPAKDKALLRIGFSVYYSRPLMLSYVFKDSDDVSYGLNNMALAQVKLYNLGSSSYVGGLSSTHRPSSLIITEDEMGTMKSIQITLPSNSTLALFATSGVNTAVDANNDGIPDNL